MYDDVLTLNELYGLKLRKLYHSYGYKHKTMSRFEDYDFYAKHKDFLTSQNILTFTDINGRLMALRPDITLSMIRTGITGKYYYDEKVYRLKGKSENINVNGGHGSSRWCEISQSGIECIGGLIVEDITQVTRLALLSLREISGGKNYALDVADAGTARSLIPQINRANILKCIQDKNIDGLKELNAPQELLHMASIDGDVASGLHYLSDECRQVITALNDPHIRIDFSALSNLTYYNGLVLKGYIEGIPHAVLYGGQYDEMLRELGHNGVRGMGFAVYMGNIGGIVGD